MGAGTWTSRVVGAGLALWLCSVPAIRAEAFAVMETQEVASGSAPVADARREDQAV